MHTLYFIRNHIEIIIAVYYDCALSLVALRDTADTVEH